MFPSLGCPAAEPSGRDTFGESHKYKKQSEFRKESASGAEEESQDAQEEVCPANRFIQEKIHQN
jgi:hypothetical protein